MGQNRGNRRKTEENIGKQDKTGGIIGKQGKHRKTEGNIEQ